MELRSGRRCLGTQPPRRAGRNCRPRRCRGGGVDHISELSDDLLIEVLVRLGGGAARTSVLSRRWRDLWIRLRGLSFRGIAYDPLEAALAQALPKPFFLDIDISDSIVPSKDFASLLGAAARLDPVELRVAARWVVPMPQIELPSFARATSITLNATYLCLAPPSADLNLPVLERLSITESSGRFDTRALITRCPRLRVLELVLCWDLDYISVHSATIEELLVIGRERLQSVDIVAPVLKKFTLRGLVSEGFRLSLLAPTVENLSWDCSFPWCFRPLEQRLHGSDMWYVNGLKLETEERGFVLGLDMGRWDLITHVRNLQEMFQFPNISVLDLCLITRGHVYGPVVLKLLKICNVIQKLKLVILFEKWRSGACEPSCPCDQQHINWRSQKISLISLEEVEIEIFEGSGHEVDFLKLLFRCAPLTKVTVKLTSDVVVSRRGCKEAYKIFKANPAVECHVYHNGKEVIYMHDCISF
ncbi:unnamed protein product [Urochloa decumbens]|uniref:FBD domain-containing protein n=1 Tax=Urochloa decumbens TaxID=240449 RepID=A0ABC9FXR7_9POAL